MTYLLDSSVLIDVLNGRNGRQEFLLGLSQRDILFACCPVNITEIYMGMRPGEEARTERLLRSLEFCPVTWEAARLAGELFRRWRRSGLTLGIADVTIAAVAITRRLVLVTDNRKHFPMPELDVFEPPPSAKPGGR